MLCVPFLRDHFKREFSIEFFENSTVESTGVWHVILRTRHQVFGGA